MGVRYQVRVKDKSGALVSIFEDYAGFLSLEYSHDINAPSGANMALRGDDARAKTLIQPDYQWEIWREYSDVGLAWYKEWEGLQRSKVSQHYENNNREIRCYAYTYPELLKRRCIAWASGSSVAQQSGPAETVMKNWVKYNIGSLATPGNGRHADGVMTGFNVETDLGRGSAWSGGRAYEELLKALQDVAKESGVDFDVIGTGAGIFEFRVYPTGRGTDRRAIGVPSLTGKNTAGNAPVIFSVENGNVREITWTENRTDEYNRVLALGQGEGAYRYFYAAEDSVGIAESITVREKPYNAASDASTAGVQKAAAAELAKTKAAERVTFQPIPTSSCAYGKHFTWGDKVTVSYFGLTTHMRINAVTMRFQTGKEVAQFDYEETA